MFISMVLVLSCSLIHGTKVVIEIHKFVYRRANSERVFDRIFAEVAGFVWFVSLCLLKIVFGAICLAVQMGAFIGIVVDSLQSALLHGNIRA